MLLKNQLYQLYVSSERFLYTADFRCSLIHPSELRFLTKVISCQVTQNITFISHFTDETLHLETNYKARLRILLKQVTLRWQFRLPLFSLSLDPHCTKTCFRPFSSFVFDKIFIGFPWERFQQLLLVQPGTYSHVLCKFEAMSLQLTCVHRNRSSSYAFSALEFQEKSHPFL